MCLAGKISTLIVIDRRCYYTSVDGRGLARLNKGRLLLVYNVYFIFSSTDVVTAYNCLS